MHSEFHRRQVQDTYFGEMGMSYLPYVAQPPTMTREQLLAQFGIPADRVLAVSSGIVHPVKRTEQVLRAIAAGTGVRDRMAYVLIGGGEAGYVGRMQQLAVELGIARSIWFLGYQPPDVLHQFLSAADFSINLRFPNSEGCSLSLVEQMSHGNPVLALDSGMYAEVPEAAVLRVESSSGTRRSSRVRSQTGRRPGTAAAHERAAVVFARANFLAGELRWAAARLSEGRRTAVNAAVRACLREVAAALSESGYPIESGTAAVEPLLRAFSRD